VPTDEEWEEFLGHFARRKVALGECGRSYATPCIHEHSCLRCPLLRPDPVERSRLIEIRDNLVERIAEAESKGWLGEAEGLRVSLDGAGGHLALETGGEEVLVAPGIRPGALREALDASEQRGRLQLPAQVGEVPGGAHAAPVARS